MTTKTATKSKTKIKAKTTTTKPAQAKAVKAPADANSKIKLLGEKNPHGEKTKDFGKFKKIAITGQTVGGALEAGIDRGYINYMVRRKLIAIA